MVCLFRATLPPFKLRIVLLLTCPKAAAQVISNSGHDDMIVRDNAPCQPHDITSLPAGLTGPAFSCSTTPDWTTMAAD
jgi:hypothetical protein